MPQMPGAYMGGYDMQQDMMYGAGGPGMMGWDPSMIGGF